MASAPLVTCFYVLPEFQDIAAALRSLPSSHIQLFLPTSEAELLESPLFGHIDICVVLFTPPKVLNLILTLNPIQWIHSFTAGVETYLTPELLASSALMTNAKGLFTETLPEYAFAVILHFAKRGEQLQRNKEAKVWDFFEMSVLYGKTILILGYGEIGQRVGRIAKNAFKMRVIAVKRNPCPCNDAEAVYGLEALHSLLPSADVIVMCLPTTPSTHHILSTAEFSLMRTTAILINLGRGDQLDESALIVHLQANKIAGAALDVTATEPLSPDDPLWQCPNLVISPHCAGLYEELPEDTVDQFREELLGFREGKLAQSKRLVHKELGY